MRIGADDRAAGWAPGRRRARQDSLGTTRISEQHRRLAVDTGEGRVDEAHDSVWLTQHHRRERDGIDAQVQQRAASELGGEESKVGVLGKPLPMIGGDCDDVAESSLSEQAADLIDVG